MKQFRDQCGRKIELKKFPPERIVSLVPSQTEFLYAIGCEKRMVGVTWFCVHPADKVKSIRKVGGTKNVKVDIIRNLEPDLIIANKEENERSQIEELSENFPVWVSDVHDLNSAYEMMQGIGELCVKSESASTVISDIKKLSAEIKPLPKPVKTLYLIWREPYMSVGDDTFIHHLLNRCGFHNVLSGNKRYPEVNIEQMQALNPELILLSSEPYPFKGKHIDEMKTILPEADIRLVDGEMFSWYGSRLIKAFPYLKAFVNSIDSK